MPAVSVLMPTHGQAAFVGRAIGSLVTQELALWELVVLDDGSPDATEAAVAPFLADARVSYHRHPANRGLGAALNACLALSSAPLVAYLPSDDLYHAGHLDSLAAALARAPSARLAYASLTEAPREAATPSPAGLQLVQLMHRRGPERWRERNELESDDLERSGLAHIAPGGLRVETGRASCTWTQHPGQRHRTLLSREDGGLNVFRARYGVSGPLRLAPSDGEAEDEHRRYAPLRWRRPGPRSDRGSGRAALRILLVGELAYNPERILALAERGHELLGLWIDDPLGFMTVGPLLFGGVGDLPRTGWREAVRAARPDVAYALLNLALGRTRARRALPGPRAAARLALQGGAAALAPARPGASTSTSTAARPTGGSARPGRRRRPTCTCTRPSTRPTG